mmetsp:Transcript_23086/g.80477  ORF Transcript_23086/g.80477 Transcript_23086/m.80477 type:complete len:309 (-) Transcript_23086:69-995(-)|eukprot:CAMPEP_0203816726 /NCGR_PEP_ID=MMETSP0115-20131106/18044_1 /ASSEMBLY_ACC=CAM_ASM_000227 /TAXON_ID=33651 /ORGANISM="Bicosoecid sp, Strain ms1" /LENGTH=308 /DNA_ID=CAMNT_0050725635 /DNA_START=121 /DNA_END=1047 /DNA_ORIENTATION=-
MPRHAMARHATSLALLLRAQLDAEARLRLDRLLHRLGDLHVHRRVVRVQPDLEADDGALVLGLVDDARAVDVVGVVKGLAQHAHHDRLPRLVVLGLLVHLAGAAVVQLHLGDGLAARRLGLLRRLDAALEEAVCLDVALALVARVLVGPQHLGLIAQRLATLRHAVAEHVADGGDVHEVPPELLERCACEHGQVAVQVVLFEDRLAALVLPHDALAQLIQRPRRRRRVRVRAALATRTTRTHLRHLRRRRAAVAAVRHAATRAVYSRRPAVAATAVPAATTERAPAHPAAAARAAALPRIPGRCFLAA